MFKLVSLHLAPDVQKVDGIDIRLKEKIYREMFYDKFGCEPEHAKVKHQRWSFMKFVGQDLDTLNLKAGRQHKNHNLAKIEQLRQELRNNPATTIKPLAIIRSGSKDVHEFTKDNILLEDGMTQSASRDTGDSGESATGGVTHAQLGTSNAGEDETHAGLQAATGNRKAYDSATGGSRSVPADSKTAKYIMPFYADTDGYSLPVVIREAGQYNAAASGVGHSRLVTPDFTLAAGEAILSQINEIMANG